MPGSKPDPNRVEWEQREAAHLLAHDQRGEIAVGVEAFGGGAQTLVLGIFGKALTSIGAVDQAHAANRLATDVAGA